MRADHIFWAAYQYTRHGVPSCMCILLFSVILFVLHFRLLNAHWSLLVRTDFSLILSKTSTSSDDHLRGLRLYRLPHSYLIARMPPLISNFHRTIIFVIIDTKLIDDVS